MNQSFTKYAPKGRDYSKSGSLFRRICAAVGVNSVGLSVYFACVFKSIGCDSSPTQQTTFFATRDRLNAYHYDLKCKPSVKRKRSEAKTKEMAEQAKETASSKKKGHDYGAGIGLAIAMGDDEESGPPNTATTATRKETLKTCAKCGGKDHQRTTSKKCRYYKGRSLPTSEFVFVSL